MVITRASMPRCGIYPFTGGILFVPTEDMWNIHEASKPSAISVRAGLGRVARYQWVRKYGRDHPWLPEWLRNSCAIPADSGGFQPTPAMLAFRQQATIRAILSAVPRAQAAWRHDRRPHVTEALLSYWRRVYRKFDWFDSWLLRGEDPSAGVVIITTQQARRCSLAWDFASFCQLAKITSDTYVRWLGQRVIPSLDWLKWLFGGPVPAGTFVVGPELQRLRGQMSRKGILRATGLNTSSIWRWERDQRTSNVIKSILAGGNGPEAEEWHHLHPITQQHMEDVSRAASLEACCDRADMSIALYYKVMKEAERCGVKNELRQYLNCEGRYASRLSGLVAENFFIPSRDMLRFRAEASREGTKQRVWSLQNLPAFEAWFRDWATPKPHRGKRHLVPLSAASNAWPGASSEARSLDHLEPEKRPDAKPPAAEQGPAVVSEKPRETRKRRAREKHDIWKQWKAEGKSYEQIRLDWQDESGEQLTREAIIKGIKRP